MRTVLFDLGGVLIRIARSWGEAAAGAGVDPGKASTDPGSGSLVRPSGNQADLQRGAISYPEFLEAEHRRLQGVFTTDELHRIHLQWLKGEYEGVTAIIQRLRDAGIRTGTLSNTDAEHWKALSGLPAISALDTHALSFELGLLKPSPEIYHAAEDLVDATGQSICYLDDLEENVEGALRCGWNASRIDPHAETAPQIERALIAFGIEC